jgi:hypothetical protein
LQTFFWIRIAKTSTPVDFFSHFLSAMYEYENFGSHVQILMQPSKQANSFGETIYGAYGEKLLG